MTVLVWAAAAVAGPFRGTIDYEIRVSGEGAALAAASMPTRVVVDVARGFTAIELSGGVAPPGRFVVDTRTGTTAYVRDDLSTRAVVAPRALPQVEWMAGDDELEGYECHQYRATSTGPTGPQTAFVWAAPRLKAPSNAFGSAPGALTVAKGGMPLKAVTQQGPVTLEIVAVRVNRGNPPKDRFVVPPAYAEGSFP